MFAKIVLAFSHPTDGNQVVDHVAKIAGRIKPPLVQDGLRKVAVLAQGVESDGLTEFLSG